MVRKLPVVAALYAACFGIPAIAGTAQQELDAILRDTARERIGAMHSVCATGKAPALRASIRTSGFEVSPAGAWCVTVLTRAGRDGTLGYVRDARNGPIMPAGAFDDGFVGGYLKREALPTGAPAMIALLPVADRCLAQQEPNLKLCTSAGYMLGLRAAHGEVITLHQNP